MTEKIPETHVAVMGTAVSWVSYLLGLLQTVALLLTILVTSVTLYLLFPKFLRRFRRDGFFPREDSRVQQNLDRAVKNINAAQDEVARDSTRSHADELLGDD